MIGPKLPEGWVSPRARRKRDLQNLRKMADRKAEYWHFQYMEHSVIWNAEEAAYAKGMADAYAEVFHSLSLMSGYPWA